MEYPRCRCSIILNDSYAEIEIKNFNWTGAFKRNRRYSPVSKRIIIEDGEAFDMANLIYFNRWVESLPEGALNGKNL
jgi:hypothetical protein